MSEQAEHRFDEKWEKEAAETGPMICGRLDMASYDGQTGEPFKNVYIRDAVMTVKGLFCDHVAYAANRFQPLKAELAALRDELARTNGHLKTMITDSCEDREAMADLCRKAGIHDSQINGDSHGVPGTMDLADMLAAKLAAAVAERDVMRKALYKLRPYAGMTTFLPTDAWNWAAAVQPIVAAIVARLDATTGGVEHKGATDG